ncbi:MAG: sigma-70 family RNA polymerase sigma factor [Deltaproteobacteria bacterium]|nr:MAG: sigma-70 family RNA polymerase sigma factor [Deltaproteobacteria bacterium]
MSVQKEEELVLVRRCRRGDKDAFARLMQKYERGIYNYTYRMLGSEVEAEDLTQDVFVAAFRNMRGFRGESRFSTWLYRIALNQTRNRIKYLSRRSLFGRWAGTRDSGKGATAERAETIADGAPSPEQWTIAKELAGQVQQCLNRLPHQARQILVLRDVQGLSYQELGEILSLNPGTVKSRLHRARIALQKHLANVLE